MGIFSWIRRHIVQTGGSRWPLVLLAGIALFGCRPAEPTPSDDEPASAAQVSVTGVDKTSFNATGSTVKFAISGETLDTAPGSVLVLHNDAKVPDAAVQVTSTEVTLPSVAEEGLNELTLIARDSKGLGITYETRFWAGSQSLLVQVVNQGGQPVTDAAVTIRLNDDQSVRAQATSGGGQATFTNLPDRTFILEAKDSSNRFASLAAIIGDSPKLVLRGFDPPSAVDNNDFSQGTNGWKLDTDGDGKAPVEIVPHVEGSISSMPASAATLPRLERRPGFIAPAPWTRAATAPQADDMDLVLNTSGEGPQSISRTFTIKPGTKNVTVRYRFITSEVPGGYFGTKYNDYFSVSIRSQKGGGAVAESNSMNGLGLSAFDASGATAWREQDLPVDEEGDTIQVDLTVANVADDLLDSQVVMDIVEEKKLKITKLQLNDIDNTALQYLSTSAHTYFSGNTRIHGTITVEGAKDDSLTSLELEVLEGGAVVARANLAAGAQGTLLTTFGDDEKVEITNSQLLFELPSAQAAAVNQQNNGNLTLRARAKSQNGEEATKESGAVQKLVRYTGNNRYGGRDEGVGGDDWVKPSVRTVIEHFAGLTWGDFSNMNGGQFAPHQTHNDGNDADGWFNGYNARDAATAQTILGHLNDATYGSRILTVYVTYQQANGNAFWEAIRDVTLNDGRQARDVIRPLGGHTTHFHWIVSE
ncbi:hypothetical protein [Calidithermus roseus]|uniref:Uncharacterized protein n=1 Tax=Calidithermus roseus TaxID=1644118 RepID=A0A399EYK1_9DEIN|nr:hypothetical protein [Calidithermus roseus]RIH88099.1 hypothetical protein Mrose_01003 [Calidithermus roseus]